MNVAAPIEGRASGGLHVDPRRSEGRKLRRLDPYRPEIRRGRIEDERPQRILGGADLLAAPVTPSADELAKLRAENLEQAERELALTTDAILAAGGTVATSSVITDQPVDALVEKVAAVEGREAIILTRPHLVAEFFHVDWTSKARRKLGVPVLHLLEHACDGHRPREADPHRHEVDEIADETGQPTVRPVRARPNRPPRRWPSRCNLASESSIGNISCRRWKKSSTSLVCRTGASKPEPRYLRWHAVIRPR